MGSAKKKQRKAAAAGEGRQKVERRFGSTSIDAVVPSSTGEWKEPQGTCWSALPAAVPTRPGALSLCPPTGAPRCLPPSRLCPAAASPSTGYTSRCGRTVYKYVVVPICIGAALGLLFATPSLRPGNNSDGPGHDGLVLFMVVATASATIGILVVKFQQAHRLANDQGTKLLIKMIRAPPSPPPEAARMPRAVVNVG